MSKTKSRASRNFHLLVFIIAFLIIVLIVYAASTYYTISSGSSVIINEFGVTRKVTNSCSRAIFVPTRTAAEWNTFRSNRPACVSLADATCSLPWGGTINEGESVTAYSTTSISCGSSCSSYSQTRTCVGGTLTGSYPYQSCSVNPSPYTVCCTRVFEGCRSGLPWGKFRLTGPGSGCGSWPACFSDGTRNWATDCMNCRCGFCCASC